MANYLRALGYSNRSQALGCACCARPLSGYIARALHGYRAVMLEGLGDVQPGTPALVPVSDRRAVAAAIRVFQMAQPRGRGLGTTEQATGAATTSVAFAKAGSIVPGIGTVIGAVVGAVVGWLGSKKPPPRPSPEQVAQCKALLDEYMAYAAQSPDAPLPLDRQQLLDLHWCMAALYGAEVGLRDPRFFNTGYEQLLGTAKQLVRKIYETPVGATVRVDAVSFKDPKGRAVTYPEYNFQNPVFTDLKTFGRDVFVPMWIQSCGIGRKDPHVCGPYLSKDVYQRLAYDTLAWAARDELPNISVSDLAAASQIAAQTGSSSSDVVQAVEQIIGRQVQQGETSALLTGSATGPPPASVPPLPPNASSDDVRAAITQLTTQLMQSQQAQAMTQQQAIAAATTAAQQWLATQGVKAPAPAVAEAAKAAVVQASGMGNLPLWLGGAALVFALARPRAYRSRGARRR